MEISNVVLVFLAITLSFQVLKAEENNGKETTKPPFNPLEDLIINKPQNVISKPSTRVKRQYGSYGGYYPDYPLPIFLPFGLGGYGAGYGRGFGGRGYAGRGFGGRGFGGRGGGFGGRGGGIGGGHGGVGGGHGGGGGRG